MKISPRSTDHNNVFGDFCIHSIIKTLIKTLAQLFQVSIHVHLFHALQQTTRNSVNAYIKS